MSFDAYKSYVHLNEDLRGRAQRISNDAFRRQGEITLSSGAVINAGDVVDVVTAALDEIAYDWSHIYRYARSASIVYVYNNSKCDTMCVSRELVITISANYVHDVLKMDKDLVLAILMHEIFHVLYDHLERGTNWAKSKGLAYNNTIHHNNNLAADIEVNKTLVNKGIIRADKLVNECHALFLDRDYNKDVVTILTMENILENKEMMEELLAKCPYEESKGGQGGDADDQDGDDQDGDNQGGSNQNGGDNQEQHGGKSGNNNQGGDNQGGDDNQDGSDNQGGNNNQDGDNQDANSKQSGQGGSGKKRDISSYIDSRNGSGDVQITTFDDRNNSKTKEALDECDYYTDEEKESIKKMIKETETINTPTQMQKRRNDVMMSDGTLRKIFKEIQSNAKKYGKMWDEILKNFLKQAHRAGDDKISDEYNWKNKKRLMNDIYGINRKKEAEDDPQDINVYVDVSDSISEPVVTAVCENLLTFCEQYKYSSINIIPWADRCGELTKIENVANIGKEKCLLDIKYVLEHNSAGSCTEKDAVIASLIKGCINSLSDTSKKTKDDVHIIITDGWFNTDNLERDMYNSIKSAINNNSKVARMAVKNSFWIIYDANNSKREELEKEIQMGKLIFVDSSSFKKNK